jgi:uncharacterized protein (DUF362 family)
MKRERLSGVGNGVTRRGFLRYTACGFLGSLVLPRIAEAAESQQPSGNPSRLALVHGDSRANNIFQALKSIEPQVREGLAKKKRVIIKPNMVIIDRQLAATHADCLEGLLEFLRPIVQEEILIAESPANGPAAEGYANYNYQRLASAYRVRLVSLDEQPSVIQHLVDERYYPRPVRVSQLLLDPDAYLISAAVLKTHDRAVVTLGLKNLAVGAILKDPGFRWGPGSRGVNDKPVVHGGRENQGIHYNLFNMAKRIHPDLTVLDGFQGMEHNGPNSGTPVDHKVVVASTDWLAADRVGVELMGFDFHKVGYLTFCAEAGMGEADLSRIEVLGERIADHARSYRPHDTIEQQYKWMRERTS